MSNNDSKVALIASALAAGHLTINRLADGSGVVLDAEREQLLSMNRTGLMILEAIAGGIATDTEIAHRLGERFGIDSNRAMKDVRQFTRQLASAL
jgi:hypothetical protein